MSSVLIVGAGISGLLAGTVLKEKGHMVTILDKGRGVGGRMATRRMASVDEKEARADHGAQFFTVRDPQFAAWVDQWIAVGAVKEWCRGFTNQDGHPRYRGNRGMTDVAKHLAAGLDVKTKTRVTKIYQRNGLWAAETGDEQLFQAEKLILTSPVPQTLVLLTDGGTVLPTDADAALREITYDPTFAVLARLSGPSQLKTPGGIQVRGEIIDWISDNQIKGISAVTTVTIHATPAYTRQHLERDRDEVALALIEEADRAGYFEKSLVEEVQVQRWMYAQPATFYGERCLKTDVNGLPIVFAGDAFLHARVEGAALSGLDAADRILDKGV
ncbi:MAG: FAD-dependent oxidoreductase [Chloroflexota bacterium]